MKRNLSGTPAADTQITPHVSNHTGIKTANESGHDQGTDLPEIEARGPVPAWLRFWFTPVDPVGLHALRVLCGLLFAGWLLAFAGHQTEFFGLTGWFDVHAYKETANLPGGAPVPFGWSILYLCGTSNTGVNLMYWGAIAVFLLFAAGVATRITAVLTWVLVVSFTANPILYYDADALLIILGLYLMVGYVLFGQWSRPLSLTERILGPMEGGVLALFAQRGERRAAVQPSYAANLALRLLQVHFALVVVTAGLHKLQMGDWWTGVAFWYPLHPPLDTSFASVSSPAQAPSVLFVLSLLAYATLAWQLCFPLFAWRQGWCRLLLLGGAALGWAGSILIYGLPLFGPIFMIAALGYLTPEEWHGLLDRFRGRATSLTGQFRPASLARKSAKIGT